MPVRGKAPLQDQPQMFQLHTADICQAQKQCMEVVVERGGSAEGSWSHSFEEWTVTATLNKQS